MTERKTVKIDANNLTDIEDQIKKEGNFKSKSQFVNEAVKEKIKKLKEEQNKSSMEIIQNVFKEREEFYYNQGIKSFEEFVKKIIINDNTINELQKSNKRIEKLEKEIIRMFVKSEDERQIQERIYQSLSEGRLKIMTPKEIKETQRLLKEGKIKDTRQEDTINYEKLIESKIKEVLSDPVKLKKILKLK